MLPVKTTCGVGMDDTISSDVVVSCAKNVDKIICGLLLYTKNNFNVPDTIYLQIYYMNNHQQVVNLHQTACRTESSHRQVVQAAKREL